MFRITLLLSYFTFLYGLACGQNAETDTARAFQIKRTGLELFEQELFDSAAVVLTRSANILEKTIYKDELANVYLKISECYYELTDCGMDVLYLERAIDLKRNIYGENSTEIALLLHDLGLALANCQQRDRAFEVLQEALSTFENNRLKNASEIASTLSAIGWMHGLRREYDSAFVYLLRSLDLRIVCNGYWSTEVASTAHMIGYYSIYSGNFEQAEKHVKMGLEIRQKVLGETHHETMQSWQKMGECKLFNRKYAESLPYLQKALAIICNRPGIEDDIGLNPKLEDVRNLHLFRQLLNMKTRALRFNAIVNNNDTALLRMALNASNLNLQVSDRLLMSYSTTSSRSAALDGDQLILDNAIKIDRLYFNMTKDDSFLKHAFFLMERNKNFTLKQSLAQEEAMKFGQLSASVLAEEKALAKAVMRAEYEFAVQKNDPESNISEKLLQTRLAYDKNMAKIKAEYPEFYKLKFATKGIDPEKIMARMNDGQMLVSYFETLRTISTYTITKDSMWMGMVTKPAEFDQTLTSFISNLTSPEAFIDNQKRSLAKYKAQAALLFEQLVRKAVDPDSTGYIPKDLLIIPDGQLSYLPFGTLVTDTLHDSFFDLQYLLKNCNVHYAYSADQEVNAHIQHREATHDLVSFAPDYVQPDSELPPLSGALKEVAMIENIVGGESFAGARASKKNFIEIGVDARIIHLAMHTILDDRQPMRSRFAFTGESNMQNQLLAHELFNMDMAAEMAVLSGCETGSGKLSRGEGVMSLSRAFAYAGCPSMVMSLWKTDDHASLKVMETFYSQLVDGTSRDEALRISKLNYLNNADELTSHPYYWAPFVLVGNSGPIEFKNETTSTSWMWYGGFGLLTLLVIGVKIRLG